MKQDHIKSASTWTLLAVTALPPGALVPLKIFTRLCKALRYTRSHYVEVGERTGIHIILDHDHKHMSIFLHYNPMPAA